MRPSPRRRRMARPSWQTTGRTGTARRSTTGGGPPRDLRACMRRARPEVRPRAPGRLASDIAHKPATPCCARCSYRSDPWPITSQMARTLELLLQVKTPEDRELAPRCFEALSQPFVLNLNGALRDRLRLNIAYALGPKHPASLAVFADLEPEVPWTAELRLQSEVLRSAPAPEPRTRRTRTGSVLVVGSGTQGCAFGVSRFVAMSKHALRDSGASACSRRQIRRRTRR
jgi:hypothetical protein